MLKDIEWEPSIPSIETCEKIWLQTDCEEIDAKFSEAEKQKLDSGMYTRIAVLISKEMADLKPLIERIEAIENVKCAIRRNDRLLYVLLFVADCLAQQDIADMSKYDVWHKHDKTAKRAVMAFQEQLNNIIQEFDIHSYQAYYATTNFGSFSTRAAGNLVYELGNDDIDQRFFACPHESFEKEASRDLNGVKGYRRIYPIVTATDEKDIYIKLMEDLTEEKIDPHASIFFDHKIDTKMKQSCVLLAKVLRVAKADTDVKIDVGINGKKYLEPCPAAYTGKLKKKCFSTVFIGLNPYSEGPRDDFPDDMTWGDLANIHHPDDLWYGYPEARYIPPKDSQKKYPRNTYWRVYGNKEGNDRWSPYYRSCFNVHIGFHWEEITKSKWLADIKPFNKWSDFKKNFKRKTEADMTNTILEILREFPIANFEAIPYKSRKYKMANFSALLENECTKSTYEKYINHIFDFIDDFSRDDAYILMTAPTNDLDAVYNFIVRSMSDRIKIVEDNYCYIYSKNPTNSLTTGVVRAKDISERKQWKIAPMYIIPYKDERTIIIAPPLSGGHPYQWIYDDLSNGWCKMLVNKDFLKC